MKSDKNIRDKLLALFSVGVGFWLINIATSYPPWFYVTGAISGLAFLLLFVYSIKAIKQKERILGWTFFALDTVMIFNWIIPFIIGFIQG